MQNNTVTRLTIARHIKKKFNMSAYVSMQIVDEIFWMLCDNLLLENRIEIRGFGVFDIVERKSKIGRNPKNPTQEIIIPSKKIVKFSQSKTLKI